MDKEQYILDIKNRMVNNEKVTREEFLLASGIGDNVPIIKKTKANTRVRAMFGQLSPREYSEYAKWLKKEAKINRGMEKINQLLQRGFDNVTATK